MTARRTLTFFLTAFIFAEAKWHNHNIQKRQVPSICNPVYTNGNKVQCYCVQDVREAHEIRSADCYLTAENVPEHDPCWEGFHVFKALHKLTFANTRGITLNYFPSDALKYMKELQRLDVKYGNIISVDSFAFANLSSLEEISLRDSQIQVLKVNAFAHHRALMAINLDKNNIVEINRDVFIDLPSLQKLYLTSNKLTTIHDRAFVHLNNLKEMEINMNKLFSLNSETFSGLKNLQKLDLSGNALEVIGDNTFTPLINLNTLNLEGNRIQMLDQKAFNGLVKLQYLNLAHNKLSTIENDKTFEGLKSLVSLSLRANEVNELRPTAMAPLFDNLLQSDASLDVEDNSFPCDCRLDWFMNLMNKTLSKNLKMALENLKCMPDAITREAWSKIEESEKVSGPTFDEMGQTNADYEYYDEAQLNGKLFYTDVRYIMDCSKSDVGLPKNIGNPKSEPKSTTAKIETVGISVTIRMENNDADITTLKPTSAIPEKVNKPTIINHGLLDLSIDETTSKFGESDKTPNQIPEGKKHDSYTTSQLATVSANPMKNMNVFEDKMASDEAKPDNFKTHRSVHDELKSVGPQNSANRNIDCLLLIFTSIIFYFRL